MNDIDRQLKVILREGAPSRRDPLFRVRVLQRLERRRFRRRLYILGIAACGAVAIAGLGAGVDVTAKVGIVLFGTVAAIAGLAHAPVVGYFWRRLMSHGGARERI